MTNKTKTTFISLLIIFIFGLVVIAYFFVYQKFMKEKELSFEIVDNRPVVSEGLSFQADVNRFLTVYDTQEFISPQDLYNFLVLELNRFLVYPAQTKEDESVKLVLTENIKKILIKMEEGDSSIDEEQLALRSLLQK